MSVHSMETIGASGLNLNLSSDSNQMTAPSMHSGKKTIGYWLFYGLTAIVVVYLLYMLGMWAYKKWKKPQPPQQQYDLSQPTYDDVEESSMMKSVPGTRYAAFEENSY